MDLPDAPPGRAADTSAVSAGGLPGNDALVSKKSDSAKHTCKAETPEGTPFWLDHTAEDPPAAGSGGRDPAEREAVWITWADAAAAEAAAAAAAAAAKDAASAVERQAQVEVAQTKVTAAQVEIAAQIKLLTLAVQERTQALNGALPGSEPGRHGNRVAVAAVASNTAAARTRSTHPDCWAKLFLPGGAALWIDPTTGVIEDADGITPVPAATDLAPAPHDSATVTQCCGDATSRSFGATRLGGVASRTTVSPHRDPGAVWRKSRRFTDPAVDPAQAVGEGQNRSPEMWNHSQLTVPSSSESVPFGCPPTQTKTHYNVYVDGVFYQSWRYSQLNRLRHDLLDALHVETTASLPKFPGKFTGLPGFRIGEKKMEERRSLIEAWLQHIVGIPEITAHPTFMTFVMVQISPATWASQLDIRFAPLGRVSDQAWTLGLSATDAQVFTLNEATADALRLASPEQQFVIRMCVKIDVGIDTVLASYADKGLWRRWAPDMILFHCIEKLDKNKKRTSAEWECTEVTYTAYTLPGVANRDIVLYSRRTRDGPDRALVQSFSVEHPAAPIVDSRIRSIVVASQTTFQSVAGGAATLVETTQQVQPGGTQQWQKFTPVLVNTLGKKTIEHMLTMKSSVETTHGGGVAPRNLPLETDGPMSQSAEQRSPGPKNA